MYTVAKAPSRLASKGNRRGPGQQIRLESYDSGNRDQVPGSWDTMSSPKAVFNGKKHYGRSNSGGNGGNYGNGVTDSPPHPDNNANHEENVRYVADAWNRVTYQLERSNGRDDGPEVYREKFPYKFNGFEPLDLEQWLFNRHNHTKN